jgi:hypothetical protein
MAGYTHQIVSYGGGECVTVGPDGKPEQLEDNGGDGFTGMGPVIEYYDDEGNNVTPMPLMQ